MDFDLQSVFYKLFTNKIKWLPFALLLLLYKMGVLLLLLLRYHVWP